MDDHVLMQNRLRIAYERNRLQRDPELHYLFFELTDRCNLSCLHCGSSCSAGRSNFLKTGKVKEIIADIAVREPRVHVVLTGGEPLLHPDLLEIEEELNKARLYWSVVTNAMLITDEIAGRMKANHIYSAAVSLDGLKEEHNRLRQNPRAYDDTLHGIENLKKHGILVQVTSVITKRTLPLLEELREEVLKLQVESWKVLNIEPIGRADSNRELLLDRDELFRLFDFIQKCRKETGENNSPMEITYGCSHFLPSPYEGEVRTTPFICGSGIMIGSVQCNGDIAGCLDIERRPELVQGSVYRDDFWEVWQDRYQVFRRDRTLDSPKCRDCRYALLCGGDSLHTWDFDRKQPKLCLI